MIGGKRHTDFPMENREPDVEVWTYGDVIGTARRQLDWQLQS